MKRELGYKNPWKEAYIPPLAASIPMGLVAFVTYKGIYALVKNFPASNFLALVPAILLAACVYFLTYLMFAKPGEEDLAGIPGGRTLVQITRKLPFGR